VHSEKIDHDGHVPPRGDFVLLPQAGAERRSESMTTSRTSGRGADVELEMSQIIERLDGTRSLVLLPDTASGKTPLLPWWGRTRSGIGFEKSNRGLRRYARISTSYLFVPAAFGRNQRDFNRR
jgi:hypothetical protein